MDPQQWVRTVAAALDVEPPSQAEVDDLLSLAGTAAHSAERWVAPITTWLIARAGVSTEAGRAMVERLGEAAAGPDDRK